MDISKLPDWFIEPYTKVPQEIHQASFSCDGKVQISIRVPNAIKKCFNTPAQPRNKNKCERKCFNLFTPRTR